MKKIAFALLIALGVVFIPAAPASAHWKPTLVPLTAEVQFTAYNVRLFDCHRYETSPSFSRSAGNVYYRAFCNPHDSFAKAMANGKGAFSRSPRYGIQKAYQQGLRDGWCTRWLGLSPIGTKVSTSCIKTVNDLAYG